MARTFFSREDWRVSMEFLILYRISEYRPTERDRAGEEEIVEGENNERGGNRRNTGKWRK